MLIQILSAVTGVIGMLVDGAVTGRCLGVEAMAAYGLAMPVLTVFAAISSVCGVGTSVLCGRTIGAGNIRGTNTVLSTSVAFGRHVDIDDLV